MDWYYTGSNGVWAKALGRATTFQYSWDSDNAGILLRHVGQRRQHLVSRSGVSVYGFGKIGSRRLPR